LEVQQIEVSRIVEDPDQPRKQQSEEALQGLADSIRQHGMLNPITITPLGESGQYRIITGERRWRAARMAHLAEIPCVVKITGVDDPLTEQLIENLQREDLQPIEKARAIKHVRTTLNLTSREIARRLGISERAVGYLLDLLALPEAIGEAVVSSPNRPADGQITEKHARFLKQLNDEPDIQTAVVDRIRDDKMSGEETGNLVKALKKHPDRAKEILDSPNEHLARFFQDEPDPAADFLDAIELATGPARVSLYAQGIVDFLPTLSGIDIDHMPLPEIRQLEDALSSLKMAADGLLKACKIRLGDAF
jgi:ParB family transcriptional regulator, chromosome partitioning protein